MDRWQFGLRSERFLCRARTGAALGSSTRKSEGSYHNHPHKKKPVPLRQLAASISIHGFTIYGPRHARGETSSALPVLAGSEDSYSNRLRAANGTGKRQQGAEQ